LIEPVAERARHLCAGIHHRRIFPIRADPANTAASRHVIAVNFTRKMVLIGGTAYAGEIKKSVFTILITCAAKRVMPMLVRQCRQTR